MFTRCLLFMSSAFGLLFGVIFLGAGSFLLANPNLITKLSDKVVQSSTKAGVQLKQDLVAGVNNTGILPTLAWTLVVAGAIITIMTVLGLLAAITGSTIIVLIYILVTGLLMIAYVLTLLLMTATTVLQKPIVDALVTAQNTKLVSLVEVQKATSGENTFMTVLINVMQLKLRCCGMRTVGDVRDSPSWNNSNRDMSMLMGLDAKLTLPPIMNPVTSPSTGSGVPPGLMMPLRARYRGAAPWSDGAAESNADLPDWVRKLIPPGATLPPKAKEDIKKAAAKLPPDFRPPPGFKIDNETINMINNTDAIMKKLRANLMIIKTPITCCKFKEGDFEGLDIRPEALIRRSLEFSNCPITESNVNIHQETCYRKLTQLILRFAPAVAPAAIIIGLMLMWNLSLAIRILCC